jgi:Na+/H+ antiporter NhaD/arsenite permease-like protein
MTALTLTIVVVFVLGYACIALESVTKVNKAAVALFMFVACWTLFMISPEEYITLAPGENAGNAVSGIMEHYLGATATTLFFLMGAMTIVEVVDQNGGFNFVRNSLQTKNKRYLLWRIAVLTFILSAVLDNMTTSIVMVMVLRKLVKKQSDRMVYASLVIIAANAGGAFSPIGDVTTIMLWNMSLITAAGVIVQLFVPSVVSMVVPALLLQPLLKGTLEKPSAGKNLISAAILNFSEIITSIPPATATEPFTQSYTASVKRLTPLTHTEASHEVLI